LAEPRGSLATPAAFLLVVPLKLGMQRRGHGHSDAGGTMRQKNSDLPTTSLREADQQVAQVGGVRRVAQERAHAEDFLDRPQRRTVRVVNTVGVPTALRHWRQYEHFDGAIAGFRLISGDEEHALVGAGLRRENPRGFSREPNVTLIHLIVQWAAGPVHVLSNVRGD